MNGLNQGDSDGGVGRGGTGNGIGAVIGNASAYREDLTRQQRRFARTQRRTIGLGILSVVAIIVILQLWLFTASMNAFLGGSFGVLLPAALGSLGCFILNLGLLWYLGTLER